MADADQLSAAQRPPRRCRLAGRECVGLGLDRLYVSTGAARTINAFLKGSARGLCLLLTIERSGRAGRGGQCAERFVEDQTGQGLTSAGLRKALGVHLRRRYIGLASITSIHGAAQQQQSTEFTSFNATAAQSLSHIPGGASSMGSPAHTVLDMLPSRGHPPPEREGALVCMGEEWPQTGATIVFCS